MTFRFLDTRDLYVKQVDYRHGVQSEQTSIEAMNISAKTTPLNNSDAAVDPSLSLRIHSGFNQMLESGKTRIVSQSMEMMALVKKTIQFASSSATVLITGESGTGKELFARLVHENSSRSEMVYGRTNCAALSESLMESELFGHERGAFTGAMESRIGWFEFARGGTLLLDEISEIPVTLQAKLLRVLEEGEFQRVGSNVTHNSDVRIVATSNLDLNQQVQNKLFRNDLYHRLNVLRLHLPPLRERLKDIPLLANHFAKSFKVENQFPVVGFSSAAMKKLCEFDWPGNVRQLRNVIHCACVVTDEPQIQPRHLPEFETRTECIPGWLMQLSIEKIEKHLILSHLKRYSGNRTLVASQLGITTRTLANKLKIYRDSGWQEPTWLSDAG